MSKKEMKKKKQLRYERYMKSKNTEENRERMRWQEFLGELITKGKLKDFLDEIVDQFDVWDEWYSHLDGVIEANMLDFVDDLSDLSKLLLRVELLNGGFCPTCGHKLDITNIKDYLHRSRSNSRYFKCPNCESIFGNGEM